MKIRMVQLLCPSRHCLAAVLYESPDGEPMPGMLVRFREQITVWGLRLACGLCESADLKFEDAVTTFESLEQARPAVAREESRQAATREVIRNLRRMFQAGLN